MLGLYEVFYAVTIFLRLITWGIVLYCVLSWFRPNFQAFFWLRRFIQPFVSPFQRLSMKVMRHFNAPVDLTCFFAIIAFQIIDRLWWRLYILLMYSVR